MITLHQPDRPTATHPATATPPADAVQSALWIDLQSPTSAERDLVESALGIRLPTEADMVEIEASSRIYSEGGSHYLTILLVTGVDAGEPAAVPVTFILLPDGQLVTLRFSDPHPFRMLAAAAKSGPAGENGSAIMLRLLELSIERTADILERLASEMDDSSRLVFGNRAASAQRLSPGNLSDVLCRIGDLQLLLHKVHASLLTMNRLVTYLNVNRNDKGSADVDLSVPRMPAGSRPMLRTLRRDIQSLTESAAFLTQNIGFLIDAAVGRISIEQSVIVKIFSVAAVIFLPPTLVASIYGMNFRFMPEVNWDLGYPWALGVMVVSALLPFLWFKHKGWL